jgi:hypothetical protein
MKSELIKMPLVIPYRTVQSEKSKFSYRRIPYLIIAVPRLCHVLMKSKSRL